MEKKNILEIRAVSKSFPGVNALSGVSFSIREGDIHALVGENGAGKSTLIKVLSGIYKADEGSVVFDGAELKIKTPLEAQRLGISVVHQEMMLVDDLSVVENIYIGKPKTTKRLGMIDWRTMRAEGEKLLNRIGAHVDLNIPVRRLSVAEKQIIEICKALSFDSKLIIMDEPSATLTEKELEALYRILRNLREKGVTIIYISHRLEEIFEIADRITVLRDGRHIETKDVKDTSRKELVSLMVGRELGQEFPKTEVQLGDVVIETKGLSRKTKVADISMYARQGEIVGIAGLVGAGRTEFARVLFGVDRKLKGKIVYKGSEILRNSVRTAIKNKIGLVPEDRKEHGLNLDMTVSQNICMVGINQILKNGLLNDRREKELAKRFIDALRIVTPGEAQVVKYLSGGNQQKVVLAKWLVVDSDLLIIDEPTRGIDVGAKAEIYRVMDSLVSEGKAIIMISSELPELIAMCDRIYVMHDGRITGELQRSDFSQEKIMSLST